MGDGREGPSRRRVDEVPPAICQIDSDRAPRIDASPWSIHIDESQRDAADTVREPPKRKGKPPLCVFAQGVYRIRTPDADQKLDWNVHQ